MNLDRLIASCAALLIGALMAPIVNAQTSPNVFNVKLYLVDNAGTSTETLTELTTTPPLQVTGTAVNLDADVPAGGARRYLANGVEVFQIARCAGCANRARVFVGTGSINRLVLTDAQITNTRTVPTPATLTLRIVASSGDLPISGPGGEYPYATELSGTFTAPLGQNATDPANRITVDASAQGDCDGACRIDNPFRDPGEEGNPFARYSIVAPPYLAAGLAQFAPKEQDILPCSNVSVCVPNGDGCDYTYSCQPLLALSVDISLKSRHGARIPGSIGNFHVPERCEPENGLLKGCNVMADFFASLGPKGFKAYFARLEPSGGIERTIDLRDGTRNSAEAWVTRRGERDDDCDDDGSDGATFSNTRARLSTNGSGVVKANGLCPATGCPASNILPVRVYCNAEIRSTTAIRLDSKGDGKANLSFSLPCPDAAVLIMDPSDAYWVAAPGMF